MRSKSFPLELSASKLKIYWGLSSHVKREVEKVGVEALTVRQISQELQKRGLKNDRCRYAEVRRALAFDSFLEKQNIWKPYLNEVLRFQTYPRFLSHQTMPSPIEGSIATSNASSLGERKEKEGGAGPQRRRDRGNRVAQPAGLEDEIKKKHIQLKRRANRKREALCACPGSDWDDSDIDSDHYAPAGRGGRAPLQKDV
mmetsp:Transcript_36677/g.72145  ORF Transcript_36677/g.72145 Transcript_36677/m.72145 type:complete len:199 (+) Transcript_36677:1426-2022(+)